MAKKKDKAAPQEWRNRIVGNGTMPASQFLTNPSNARIHPKAQQEALRGALNDLGWIQNVVVNKTSGLVIDGHARIAEALKLGDETPVPYVEVELSEAEEKLALASLDPIAAMAAYDKAQLDALLRDVNTGEAGLQAMLAELAQDNGLDYGAGGGVAVEDVEPQIDKAAELQAKWQVKRGDVWQLGNHRLMCGDSTSAEDVARLMAGEKADMVMADPPYGINYQSNMRQKTAKFKPIQNDSVVDDAFLDIALNVSTGFVFVWATWKTLREWLNRLGKLELTNVVVWDKGGGYIGDLEGTFGTDYELALVFNRGAVLTGKRVGSVWSVGKDAPSAYLHPTQKPVDLYLIALNSVTQSEDIVLDPFSGSGTTIIACEQLGRKCRAMEISPEYVSVALERWSTATGKQPQRITEGA